jgi:hypothetical protein
LHPRVYAAMQTRLRHRRHPHQTHAASFAAYVSTRRGCHRGVCNP